MTRSSKHEKNEPGETRQNNFPALACDMTAIAAEQRPGHQDLAEHLFLEAVQEVRELPDGYAYRFTAEDYPALTRFIANERLCCPFFSFGLEVTPQKGPVWLRLSGGEGVKEYLRAQMKR